MVTLSIIIPTYNERENIQSLIERILEVFHSNQIDGEIIIIDDDSPDGTGKFVENFFRGKALVITRKKERGLSSAVVEGFEKARGDIYCVMDADLSHPPEMIPKLLDSIFAGADIAIGSRYIEGGKINGWKWEREIISKIATLLARPITNIKDPLSGFFMLKKNVIRGVALDSKGYKIGMEILAKGNYERVKEIPYAFTDRKYGDSKLNFRIVGEYTSQLISLYFGLFGQFIKFCAVGGIGAAINLFALYFLVEFIHLWYIFGAAVAFVMAVSSNFILNKRWTFDDRRKGLWAIKSYVKFFVISIAGLAINLSVLYLLVEYFSAWYIFAQVVAIVAATIWNFTGSKKWAFK